MAQEPVKAQVIEQLIAHLDKEKMVYERIAAQSRLDAIDGEMKQEGKYDTRAIEAGYLAGAQKRRLEEIILEIQRLQAMLLDLSTASATVATGSLVQLESAHGEAKWYFISPTSGGIDVDSAGEVKVVSIQSPIARALVGLGAGDETPGTAVPLPIRNAIIIKVL